MGEKYAGIVGSDRYSAYNGLAPKRRKVCWAHLKRDFQALVERGGESQIVGGYCWRKSRRPLPCVPRYGRGPCPVRPFKRQCSPSAR
ncbi:MAG: transposase [Anaerolineales bacterium]|nr:transposase [Anaerolineales bacterium]